MSWSELVGQQRSARLLRGAVAGRRLSHAYLFSGPAGVGKRDAGRILAKALFCQSPPVPGESCDRCLPCRKVDGGIHPDVLLVQPVRRQIRIWQITHRDETDQEGITAVRSFLALRPGEADWKVVILADGDLMTEEAANALLKSLEEPPPYAVLVLCTANPAGLLPTIRSRCQPLAFPPAAPEAVAAALEGGGLPPDRARLLAALSGGSIGRARALADDDDLSRRREEARMLLAGLSRLDDVTLLERAEELDRRKEELPEILHLILLWLRDALVYAQTGAGQLVVGTDQLPFVQELAGQLGPGRLIQMIDAVGAAQQALDRNANARLVLDVMLLKLAALAHQGPMST